MRPVVFLPWVQGEMRPKDGQQHQAEFSCEIYKLNFAHSIHFSNLPPSLA
jgi:hypothetical protein